MARIAWVEDKMGDCLGTPKNGIDLEFSIGVPQDGGDDSICILVIHSILLSRLAEIPNYSLRQAKECAEEWLGEFKKAFKCR